jgi:MerR family transcriptional regulator, redox-sensitive transcriptional activator SoxR
MMAIGEVARRAGLRPSALRYYERLGLLPEPGRASGRRRYDDAVLLRLRVIGFGRECGFSLREIRQLFAGRPYSATLRGLASRKLIELSRAIERLQAMRGLLRSALRCDCLTLEQCGRRIDPAGRARRGG